jgi:hypothetical protein
VPGYIVLSVQALAGVGRFILYTLLEVENYRWWDRYWYRVTPTASGFLVFPKSRETPSSEPTPYISPAPRSFSERGIIAPNAQIRQRINKFLIYKN